MQVVSQQLRAVKRADAAAAAAAAAARADRLGFVHFTVCNARSDVSCSLAVLS